MIERHASGSDEDDRDADREHRQRQLDPAQNDESLDRIRRNLVQRIRQLHDERSHEHRAGEEERIETRQEPDEEQDRAADLGPGGEVPEEGGDVVVGGHVGGESSGASLSEDLRPAVGEEDRPGRETQDQRGDIAGNLGHAASSQTFRQRAASADRLLAPLLSFVFAYVATFILLAWLRFPFIQWTGLICVGIATAITVAVWERGRWNLGFFVTPRRAVPEFAHGMLWGFLLISACAALVVFSTDLRHARGDGFPWLEMLIVFLPAVIHEELLFRGYPFQKLMQWNRWFAIVFIAFVFAALHGQNESVSIIGLTNIFLGGILLGLAYERYGRLWFPIGLHLAWNLTSGPILGHEVSGYESMRSLWIETGSGSEFLTGGEFGIEGSIWMTLTEVVAIALLLRSTNMIRARGVKHADAEGVTTQ